MCMGMCMHALGMREIPGKHMDILAPLEAQNLMESDL